MKVKAKHWLNVDGNWHPAGDIFDVESVAGIETSVEVISEPESDVEPVKQETEPEQVVEVDGTAEPVKSVRRRKTKKA